MKMNVSQERLKEVLRYNRRTGVFIWRVVGPLKRKAIKARQAGGLNTRGYRCITIDGGICSAGRLAWLYCYGMFPRPPVLIDHINGRRDDNRIKNLRLANAAQQAMNRIGHGKSKYRGVSELRGRWVATAGVGGKPVYLGTFKTEKAAAKAYRKYARPLFGEWFRT